MARSQFEGADSSPKCNTLSYADDATGNRVSATENGAVATPTVSPTSNRLTALGGPQWRNLAYNPLGHVASETRWDGSPVGRVV